MKTYNTFLKEASGYITGAQLYPGVRRDLEQFFNRASTVYHADDFMSQIEQRLGAHGFTLVSDDATEINLDIDGDAEFSLQEIPTGRLVDDGNTLVAVSWERLGGPLQNQNAQQSRAKEYRVKVNLITVIDGYAEGINEDFFVLDGRKWQTQSFATDKGANDWMEKNPGWGVIGQKDGKIHVAKNSDKGTPINESTDLKTLEKKTSLAIQFMAQIALENNGISKDQFKKYIPQMVNRLLAGYDNNSKMRNDINGAGNRGRDTVDMWFDHWAKSIKMNGDLKESTDEGWIYPIMVMASLKGKMVKVTFASEKDFESWKNKNEGDYVIIAISERANLREDVNTGEKDGDSGYVAFYKGKRIEVYADTSYQAQLKAAKIFNAKKSYEVTVVLARKNGKDVIHKADF